VITGNSRAIPAEQLAARPQGLALIDAINPAREAARYAAAPYQPVLPGSPAAAEDAQNRAERRIFCLLRCT
jgi:hypothetical protein